ncbi:MAG: MerR family transcriptional regulator [Ignavibacteriaceae bacterium]|jgi:Predicted transcriptional regulators|nr:MAG: MerR family transcriptional regulator [Chlorobiota bacterium]KXK02591.1 MAG: transcriptional regulator [Chlorobi bacterium OLB4]MBV6398786.1 hypothetical protein [Ignavibacteria bacterium]MCC6885042.1 MerR family transcriptional regulator [Ignavibacteriales bacterium]MCE7952167.1 MerR family transcriptional regulator [Chlorobi bacterium CHB7]MDL1886276.1 MerR family transcriptional regulator [Ignavibacteria bacterium CHB1]MEB2329453.1 MerR family transcriptional regulator [Ignavibacte
MPGNFSLRKLYYSISEVSKISDLEQYVLRYWETEFEHLKPAKNLAGNRIYTNKDIKLILYIKKLLREEKYTIEGAKIMLKKYTGREIEDYNDTTESEKNSNMEIVKQDENESYSLFNNPGEEENISTEQLQSENKKLRKDLYEIKKLLKDLLDEI